MIEPAGGRVRKCTPLSPALTGKQIATIPLPAGAPRLRWQGTVPSTSSSLGEPGGSAQSALPPIPPPFPREERLKMRPPPMAVRAAIPPSTQTGLPPASPSAIRADRGKESMPTPRVRNSLLSHSRILPSRVNDSPPARPGAGHPPHARHTLAPLAPCRPASHGPRQQFHRRNTPSPARAPTAEHHFPCAATP